MGVPTSLKGSRLGEDLSHARDKRERADQKYYQKKTGRGGAAYIGRKERLCALSIIKRTNRTSRGEGAPHLYLGKKNPVGIHKRKWEKVLRGKGKRKILPT